jgi:phosphoribosylglycinamide formyltransferase 1
MKRDMPADAKASASRGTVASLKAPCPEDGVRLNIAVLASGGGTNLQALLDAWRTGQFEGSNIAVVGSDRGDAGALRRAAALEVPTFFLEAAQFTSREAFDEALVRRLDQAQVELVCLAGYMRILTASVVARFRHKIINIHPSLLPSFGGPGMYGHHVHEAVLKAGAKFSGCTVHFVDEGTDTGPIILQAVVPVLDNDTPASLGERVLIEEHRLYPRAVALFCTGRLRLAGRRVHILEKA